MEGDPEAVALPEDALAEILRRLPPRGLAALRCVCKAWPATVDGRRLLRPELLPHSVCGIFIMYSERDYPAFLSHPSMEPDIFGKLNFHRLPDDWNRAYILGHCNGLLLYKDMRGLHVANPAAQWRASLPPPPPPGRFSEPPHLVFDPTESLHYEVFLNRLPWRRGTSHPRNGHHEHGCCVRSHHARGSGRRGLLSGKARPQEYGLRRGVAPVQRIRTGQNRNAYWQGALFVQCNGGFTVMRISLSNNKYRVIKMPTDIEETEYYDVYLGRSKEGLCCG